MGTMEKHREILRLFLLRSGRPVADPDHLCHGLAPGTLNGNGWDRAVRSSTVKAAKGTLRKKGWEPAPAFPSGSTGRFPPRHGTRWHCPNRGSAAAAISPSDPA